MPKIGRIQSTNFQTLLTSLGIVRNDIPFDLRSEVTPVVLVGGTVSFVAAPTPPYRVVDWFTEGEQVAAPVLTLHADTGALPVGAYSAYIIIAAGENKFFRIEWRNFDNTATLQSQLIATIAGLDTKIVQYRFEIENASERMRVINVGAFGVGISSQVTILAKI